MPSQSAPQGIVVLIAASLLAAVLGSVHAFSVFLVPLETSFGASRAAVSLTYSLALVALTIAVLFGHHVFGRLAPALFVVLVSLLAALGGLVAGLAPGLGVVWLGYSLMFGVANGLGYGFGLQLAAQSNPGREGLAMGIVTAAYALGAAVSPALFVAAIGNGGFLSAMLGLGATVLLIGAVAAILLHKARAVFQSPAKTATQAVLPARDLILLWLGYGGGVACGLMAIGHAAGIATAMGYTGASWIAPAVIALCNLIGSLVAGRMIDQASARNLLIGLPALSAVAVGALAITGSADLLLISFAALGFAYGGIIAAFPAAIAKIYGALESPRFYGRVFTAWGTAGLVAPWLAGQLFDWSGSYQSALLLAGGMGGVSITASLIYFARSR